MRFLMTEDALPRPHEMGADDAVRRGPRRHPQDFAIGFEQVRKTRVERTAQRVAVIGGVDLLVRRQQLPHGRIHGGGIIGEETGRGPHASLSYGDDPRSILTYALASPPLR